MGTGLEYVVPLVISLVGAGVGYVQSEKAAEEAEDIADENARREQREAEEMAQRATKDADRQQSLARAKAAASGAGGESTDLYLDDLRKSNMREISWMRTSAASRAAGIRKEGKYAANRERAKGAQGLVSAAGDVASFGTQVDWSSFGGGGSKWGSVNDPLP